MVRPLPAALLVLASTGAGCRQPPGGDSSGDSSAGDTHDSAADEAWRGIASHAAILVPDGARIEDTFGDEGTYGAGFSDAYGGPTCEIMPEVRARLFGQGSLAKPAYNAAITITAPAHADLVTGARLPYGHFPGDDGAGLYRPVLPTLFELARTQLGVGASGAVFTANSVHLEAMSWGLYPGYGESVGGTWEFVGEPENPDIPNGSDAAVIDAVQDRLEAGAALVVANLHQIDRAGHYNPPRYIPDITAVDAPLADLWDRIEGQDGDLAGRTVLAIASDHGRHRWDTTTTFPWENHGDHCSGCREIPLLLLGPGVRRGATLEAPVLFEDLGVTVAWLLGLEVPLATGRVMVEALAGAPDGGDPTGVTRIHGSGDLQAWQEFLPDPANRSRVVAGDDVFADPSALLVEEPRVLRAPSADYLCYRSLHIRTADREWRWLPHCWTRLPEGDWMEMDAPAEGVWAFWSPSLASDSRGRFYLAETANVNGNAEGPSTLSLLRWTPGRGWEGTSDGSQNAWFPTHPALAIEPSDAVWVAFSTGDGVATGRYTRHAEVRRVIWETGSSQRWGEADWRSPVADAWGTPIERVEDPALALVDGVLTVACTGFTAAGGRVLAATRDAAGGTWTERTLDASGLVLGTVPVTFTPEGDLVWARLRSDGDVEVCRSAAGTSPPACSDTGFPYLEALTPRPGGVTVTVSGSARRGGPARGAGYGWTCLPPARSSPAPPWVHVPRRRSCSCTAWAARRRPGSRSSRPSPRAGACWRSTTAGRGRRRRPTRGPPWPTSPRTSGPPWIGRVRAGRPWWGTPSAGAWPWKPPSRHPPG
jgi:hypothetical protein